MRLRIVVLAGLVALLCVARASAFDGNRAGFVVGGGVGFSPEARWENNDMAGFDDQGAGGAFGFLIGYGWNNNNLLVWDMDLAYVKGDVDGVASSILQGYGGPAWYRYFGAPGKAVILTVGLGLTRFMHCPDGGNDCYLNGGGGCLRIGVGYEFVRHFQAGVTVSNGISYDESGHDFDHTTLNVLVSGVAF